MESTSPNTQYESDNISEEIPLVLQFQKCLQSLTQFEEHAQKIKNYKDSKKIPPGVHVKVGILGAGVAGLNAAMQFDILNKNGYNIEYEILEGENRAGGRIFTHKYPTINEERWQYSDMGAMRLPIWHSPTYDLIAYTNERIQEYNVHVDKINNDNKDTVGFTPVEKYPLIDMRDYFFDSRDASAKDLNDPEAASFNLYYSKHLEIVLQKREIDDPDLAFKRGGESLKLQAEILKEIRDTYEKDMKEIREEFVRAIKKTVQTTEEANVPIVWKKIKELLSAKPLLDLLDKYDNQTVLDYLVAQQNFGGDQAKINDYKRKLYAWESLFSFVGFLDTSLVEQIFEDKDFDQETPYEHPDLSIWDRGPAQYEPLDPNERKKIPKWHTISGGLQKLTDGMFKVIGTNKVRFNQRVTRVTYRCKKVDQTGHSCELSGENECDSYPVNERIEVLTSNGITRLYDRVIVTLPTAACANIDWTGFKKFRKFYEAFRNLNADPLFKHSLEFNHRFWEDTNLLKENYAFVGGQIVSNLSSRNLVFPCYGYKDTKGEDSSNEQRHGTVLCYNFYQDGIRFIGLTEEERTQRVLTDIDTVFKKLVKEPSKFRSRDYYTGNSFSQSWANTPGNGLAFFRPGQYETLNCLDQGYKDLLYFAGEHLSVHHGWIVGALQSANKVIQDLTLEGKKICFLAPKTQTANGNTVNITPLPIQGIKYARFSAKHDD